MPLAKSSLMREKPDLCDAAMKILTDYYIHDENIEILASIIVNRDPQLQQCLNTRSEAWNKFKIL